MQQVQDEQIRRYLRRKRREQDIFVLFALLGIGGGLYYAVTSGQIGAGVTGNGMFPNSTTMPLSDGTTLGSNGEGEGTGGGMSLVLIIAIVLFILFAIGVVVYLFTGRRQGTDTESITPPAASGGDGGERIGGGSRFGGLRKELQEILTGISLPLILFVIAAIMSKVGFTFVSKVLMLVGVIVLLGFGLLARGLGTGRLVVYTVAPSGALVLLGMGFSYVDKDTSDIFYGLAALVLVLGAGYAYYLKNSKSFKEQVKEAAQELPQQVYDKAYDKVVGGIRENMTQEEARDNIAARFKGKEKDPALKELMWLEAVEAGVTLGYDENQVIKLWRDAYKETTGQKIKLNKEEKAERVELAKKGISETKEFRKKPLMERMLPTLHIEAETPKEKERREEEQKEMGYGEWIMDNGWRLLGFGAHEHESEIYDEGENEI